MAGQYSVILKASSTLISNMIELTIFLLWFVLGLALCSPVTAGVSGTVQTFYCEKCALNVTKVFCNDEKLLDDNHIPNCSGPPSPNSVCQRDGSVFVSINTSGDCDFDDHSIKAKKCPGPNNICHFNDPTSSSTVSPSSLQEATEDHTKHFVIGVVVPGLLLVLAVVAGVLAAYFCKNRGTRQLNPQQSDPGEPEALEMDENSGVITERAPLADPGSDDDTSPSQP